ncbi:MAG: hypothetical protein LCH69_09040 [Proteobacteria bacterium]|nr:hypothetical protein [Pseudomonadota bacterium]
MTESAFKASSFENLFDRFVAGYNEGRRVDDIFRDVSIASKKSADYFFPNESIIVELKTLNENHNSKERILKLVDDELARKKYRPQLRDEWLNGRAKLPKCVARKVNDRIQNSLKNLVRKANEQIVSTRSLIGARHDAILIVANLNEFLFGPIELLRNLSGHALKRSSPAIDAILLITPGVTYSAGGGTPQHYIAPAFAEGKEYLADFVEPFAESWIEFESQSLGLRSEVEKVFDFDEASLTARPVI